MKTTWAWATVTAVGPLRVQIDGDPSPLSVTPISLVSPAIGNRVRVEITNFQIIIHGIAV